MKKFFATFVITALLIGGACPFLNAEAAGFKAHAQMGLMDSSSHDLNKSQTVKHISYEEELEEMKMSCCDQNGGNYSIVANSNEKQKREKIVSKVFISLVYKVADGRNLFKIRGFAKKNDQSILSRAISHVVRLE